MVIWQIFILALFIYKGESLLVSTNNLTWIEAQNFCRDQQESLIPGTKEDFPSPHWTGHYHRLSDWIHVLGCYDDKFAEGLGVQSNHTLVKGSVGLCQERCRLSPFALKKNRCLCLENIPQINSLLPSRCDWNCPSDDDSHSNDCGGSDTYNVYKVTPRDNLRSEETVNCVVLGCYERYAQIHTNNCTEDLGRVCNSEESTNKTLPPDEDDFKSWSQTYTECREEGSYLYGNFSLNEDPRELCKKLYDFKSNTPETWLGVARQVYRTEDRGETHGVVISCQICYGQSGCSFVENCGDNYRKAYAVCGNANDLLDTTAVTTTTEQSTSTTTTEIPTITESLTTTTTTENPTTTTESSTTTTEILTTTTKSPTTTENPSVTTTESPTTITTTASPTTITTTESLTSRSTTTESPTTTIRESHTTTTEIPTTITTESPTTTITTATTTESPKTTESLTTTENPKTTERTSTAIESPTTTKRTSESLATTKESPSTTESPTTTETSTVEIYKTTTESTTTIMGSSTTESSSTTENRKTTTESPTTTERHIATGNLTTESSTTIESPSTDVTEARTSSTSTNLTTPTPVETTKTSTTEISTERSTVTTRTQVTTGVKTTSETVTQGPIPPESQTGTDAKAERAITVVVSVSIVGILLVIIGIICKQRKKIPFRRRENPIGITYRHFSSGITNSIYDQISLPDMALLNVDSEKENIGDINEVGAYYQEVHTEDESNNGNFVSEVPQTKEQEELLNNGNINHVIQNGGNTREQAVVKVSVNKDSSKKISVRNSQTLNSESAKQLHESPSNMTVINVTKSPQAVASGDRPKQTMTKPNSRSASRTSEADSDTKKNVSVIQVSNS